MRPAPRAPVERERGRYDEAVQILDQALVMAKPFAPLTGQILVEKAEVELALERPTRAMVLYEAALPVARQAVDVGLQARVFRGMSKVYSQQGRPGGRIPRARRSVGAGGPGESGLPAADFDSRAASSLGAR